MSSDGFNIMPPVLPSGLAILVEQVVPILQRRGLFRTEYEGKTLRENYGLARPQNANEALEGRRLSRAGARACLLNGRRGHYNRHGCR